MSFIPFDPPTLLQARRQPGFVEIPTEAQEAAAEGNWSGNASTDLGSLLTEEEAAAARPLPLRRKSTMNGNIILLDTNGKAKEKTFAFWLHRKIGRTSHGVVRVGFVLRRKYQADNDGEEDESSSIGTAWEMDANEDGSPKMVAVKVLDSRILQEKNAPATSEEDSSSVMPIHESNPLHELKAYEMIAKYSEEHDGEPHVIGTNLIGSYSSQDIYAVLPFHRDGTLLQYCQEYGTLSEPVARFFFRRILKGLKTLRDVGLSHRNLSLESIVLDRDLVHISRLGWCLRYSSEPPADGITAPLPVNSEPQYIPPEFFRNTEVVWDGYATDLWASGLILFSMVVSSHALFSAPVPEDRLFVELCEQGNIKQVVERFGKATKRQLSLSSDLEDLLQKMLKADPAQRLSLDQVMEHAWLKGEEISPWAS